ncbi:conserved hypothetical protein [Chelatococcus asaccharovorans]|uniref:Uncharacterized protein n=1 Tax=Chelatococcus asaccharovorans TaxID=28210 RepID=A0A2V3TW44_9HYPH|nr:hypothetical protein C7450_114120 [Chelatococcus asaccharovorans]CAH1665975.1 conserved hypothetical protein [Chelatococcus asaccharovorans]CAH1681689.1 conserved hypothetical protein [Chelatococcus asaccharovorans]
MPFPLTALAIGAHLFLVAEGPVPTLDTGPSCRAAAEFGAESKTTFAACMADENSARVAIEKEWKTFDSGSVARCLSETRSDGTPSYVELQECLELARDSKKYQNQPQPKI